MKEGKIELRLGRGGTPQLRRTPRKRKRFTLARQQIFFAELAATCNVTAAYRKARIGRTCVYDHRCKYAAFRARWAEAVREAYARLELMLIERMMNGTVKTITRADGSVDRIHEYPNAVAVRLLQMHKASAAEAEEAHDLDDLEEARARVVDKIERLRRRLEREDRARDQGGSADGAEAPEAPDSPPPAL